MSLRDELSRLVRDHKEGDVFLCDLAGKTYTPQQLLKTLSRSDLNADTGGEGAGTEHWITKLKSSIFGGVKSTKWFRVHGNPERCGWARRGAPDEPYKIHFMKFDESQGLFVSLCKRECATNDAGIAFPDISESAPNVCKFCLRKLHPEQYKSDNPKAPRPKKRKLEVSREEANKRLQDAVRQALTMFEEWGLRRDALNEYWHTVYHLDRETGEISIRFVQKHAISEKQLASAKRAFKAIMTESEKDSPRIKDYDEAERLVNLLADALRFAGYELNDKGNWIQVAK